MNSGSQSQGSHSPWRGGTGELAVKKIGNRVGCKLSDLALSKDFPQKFHLLKVSQDPPTASLLGPSMERRGDVLYLVTFGRCCSEGHWISGSPSAVIR